MTYEARGAPKKFRKVWFRWVDSKGTLEEGVNHKGVKGYGDGVIYLLNVDGPGLWVGVQTWLAAVSYGVVQYSTLYILFVHGFFVFS